MLDSESDDESKRKKPPTSKGNSSSKKSLVKVKRKTSKKAKNLFEQLTFVEEHQETFYIGLNENINGANNPITAKEIDLNQAEDIAKNWVI